MATIIAQEGKISIVRLEKGEEFYVKQMVPEGIDTIADFEPSVRSGSGRIIPTVAMLAAVEGLHESQNGCFHMRFARADRDGNVFPEFAQVRPWPRMRVAMGISKVPTIRALGGLSFAIVFDDEVAIPNFGTMGSSGWIINRSDIGKYLNMLPAIPKETGEIDKEKSIATFYVAWNGSPPECFFHIYRSQEEAEGMIWMDHSWQSGPRGVSPCVTRFEVGISMTGNPIIISSSGSKEMANVPFDCRQFRNGGSLLLPVGEPIEISSSPRYKKGSTSRSHNRARNALLEYYNTFSRDNPEEIRQDAA